MCCLSVYFFCNLFPEFMLDEKFSDEKGGLNYIFIEWIVYKKEKAVITTTNLQFYNLKSNTMKNTLQKYV